MRREAGQERPGRDDAPRDLTGLLPEADLLRQSRPPLGAHAVLILLALMLVAALAWAYFSELERLVTARGRIVATRPSVVVQPLERSVVLSLCAGVGQTVKQGQVIATLDPTFAQTEVARLGSEMHGLVVQQERLEAQLAGRDLTADPADPEAALQADLAARERGVEEAKLAALDQQLARLKRLAAGKAREIEILEKQRDNLAEVLAVRRSLYAEKHESRLRVLDAQYQHLQVLQALNQAREALDGTRLDLERLEAERRALTLGWQEKATRELVEVRRRREDLEERLGKAQRIRELVELRAPAPAMVMEVAAVAPGSVVQPGQTLFTLAPLDVPLEAEILISPGDIGFVRPGASVRLKLDAFPFQRHGTADATVRSISEDVVPEQGARGGRFFYLARLRIDQVDLRGVPADFRLIPGMSLTAEIAVGSQSVLSYILNPLIKGLDESLNEP